MRYFPSKLLMIIMVCHKNKWTTIKLFVYLIKYLDAQEVPSNVPQIEIVSSPEEALEFLLVLPESDEETKTKRVIPLAMPIPMQKPVQIAVEPVLPPRFCHGKPCPHCPPCLCAPSCTPSFFSYCSPCHQKCRCRRYEDAPQPLPLNPPEPLMEPVFAFPAPVASPVMMIPYPWSGYEYHSKSLNMSNYLL